MTHDPLPELPAGAFDRQDEGDDLAFYAPPRLVTHIDEAAVVAVDSAFRQQRRQRGVCEPGLWMDTRTPAAEMPAISRC